MIITENYVFDFDQIFWLDKANAEDSWITMVDSLLLPLLKF